MEGLKGEKGIKRDAKGEGSLVAFLTVGVLVV